MSNSRTLVGLTALALIAGSTPAYALNATGATTCPSCPTPTAPRVTGPATTPAPRRHRRSRAPAAPASAPASAPFAAVAPFSCERSYLPAADLNHDHSVTANELLTYFSRQAHGVRREARRLMTADGLNYRELRADRSRVVCSLPAEQAAAPAGELLNPFPNGGDASAAASTGGTTVIIAPVPAPAPAAPAVDLEAALRAHRDEILAGVRREYAAHARSPARSPPLGLSLGIGPGALIYNDRGNHLAAAGTIEGRIGYDPVRWLTLQVAGGRVFGHGVRSSRTLPTLNTHSDPADNRYGYYTESAVGRQESARREYDGFVQVAALGNLGRGVSVGAHLGLMVGEETTRGEWNSVDRLYAVDGQQVGPAHRGEGVDAPVVHRVRDPVVGFDLEKYLRLGRTAAVTHQLRLHLAGEYNLPAEESDLRMGIDYGIRF